MPLRAMTRMVASWIDWTRNSWTTSSFERMFIALNARSVNQNFRSEVKEKSAGDTEDLQYDKRECRQVSARDLTAFSFLRATEESRPTFMWSARMLRRNFGSILRGCHAATISVARKFSESR